MELALCPNEIVVLDKKQVVDKLKIDMEKFEDEISRISDKYQKASVKSYTLSNLTEFTGKSQEQYSKELTEFCKKLTEKRLKKSLTKDELAVQGIVLIDDLNKQINLLMARIREWYALADPKKVFEIGDHESLVKEISSNVEGSLFGMILDNNDKKTIQVFAQSILNLYKLKEDLEKYVDKVMEEIAPNVRALAGSLLGARLISKAGGLKRLAMMPGSTIQVIGAERALFRHLIKGTPSPKHGLIYQHPLISGKPKALRGRIARSLAAKLALAARIDFYGGGLNEKLIRDFKKRVEEVK